MGDILVKAPEDDDPSKFMQGTDMRTSAAKRAEILRRMKENPGYLDSIMDLSGIDKELAYRVKAIQNLSMDEFLDRLISTVQGEGQGGDTRSLGPDEIAEVEAKVKAGLVGVKGFDEQQEVRNKILREQRVKLTDEGKYVKIIPSLPLISTEGEVSAEGRKDSRARRIAVQEAAATGDREEPNIVRDKGDKDIGRVFGQFGDTRPLEPEEIAEVKEKVRAGQVGVKGLSEQQRVRDKILEEEGVKLTGRGKYVKIIPPKEADTNPLRELSEDELAESAARFAMEDQGTDKLEGFLANEKRIMDELEGRKRVLRPRGSGRFQEMRAGLQDELEQPLSEGDERLSSFSAYKQHILGQLREGGVDFSALADAIAAIEGPENPTEQGLSSAQLRAGERRKKGDFVDPRTGKPNRYLQEKFTQDLDKFQELKQLASDYNKQIKEMYQKELDNLAQTRGERKRNIREGGALAEQLEGEGLEAPTGINPFFRRRQGRTGEVFRDYAEERDAKGAIKGMIGDDPINLDKFAKLASNLGLDLRNDADTIEHFKQTGANPNEIPDLKVGRLGLREIGAEPSGKRLVRRRFTGTDEEKSRRDFIINRIAEYVAEHEDIDKINELLGKDLEIAPKTLSRNERKDLEEQLEKVRRQIQTERDNQTFRQQQQIQLNPEFIAESARQRVETERQQAKSYRNRNINQMLPLVIANHPQKQLIRDRIKRAREEGNDAVANIFENQGKRFEEEEFQRLRKPLEEATEYILGKIEDDIKSGVEGYVQPTRSQEELPPATAAIGTTARSPKLRASVKNLEARLQAVEEAGDEEAANKLRAQIAREKEQNVIRAGKEGDSDFGKERYTHYTTDPRTDLTSATTKTRPVGFATPTYLRGLTENEKVDIALNYLLDDHMKALKEGTNSAIDDWDSTDKGKQEKLYRNALRSVVPEYDDKGNLVKPGGSPLHNLFFNDDEEATRLQVPRPVGIQPLTAGGAGAIGQAAPLSNLERKIRQRGEERAQAQQIPEEPMFGTRDERLEDMQEIGINTGRPELFEHATNLETDAIEQRIKDQEEQFGSDVPITERFNLGPSPWDEEPPAPQLPAPAPMPAPAPQMPPAPAPAPQMPPAPAPAPQMPEGVVAPPPEGVNPFADVPNFNQPPSVASTESPQITREMFDAMSQQEQANLLNSLSPDEQAKLISSLTKKSEPMLNFTTTKGDELLKSLKDIMWRQGY